MVLVDREGTDTSEYRWVVFELTPEQAEDEERWHALFSENVGDHWCFHGAAVEHTAAREPATPDGFFSAHKTRRPIVLDRGQARGWTDEMPKG
jgi:hypothetical protein